MKRNWKDYAPLLCRGLLCFLNCGHGGLNHRYKPITGILILGLTLVCVFAGYAFGAGSRGSQVITADRAEILNGLGETSTLDRPNVVDDLVIQDLDLGTRINVERDYTGVTRLSNPSGHGSQLESAISSSPVSVAANSESVSGVASDERACHSCKDCGGYWVHEYILWSFVGCFIGVALLCGLSFLHNSFYS